MPECSLEQVATWLVKSRHEYMAKKGEWAVGVQKYFEGGMYQNSQTSKPDEGDIFTDNPAIRAQKQLEES